MGPARAGRVSRPIDLAPAVVLAGHAAKCDRIAWHGRVRQDRGHQSWHPDGAFLRNAAPRETTAGRPGWAPPARQSRRATGGGAAAGEAGPPPVAGRYLRPGRPIHRSLGFTGSGQGWCCARPPIAPPERAEPCRKKAAAARRSCWPAKLPAPAAALWGGRGCGPLALQRVRAGRDSIWGVARFAPACTRWSLAARLRRRDCWSLAATLRRRDRRRGCRPISPRQDRAFSAHGWRASRGSRAPRRWWTPRGWQAQGARARSSMHALTGADGRLGGRP